MDDNFQIIEDFGRTLTVLYVEDNEMVRESTSDMLHEYFKHIDTANDGVEGLQQYKEYHTDNKRYYDIVITDINMPNMNGIEMIEQILELREEQQVVIISAHNESDYLLQLIDMGVSNFILKPIKIMQFQKIIFRIVKSLMNQEKLSQHQNKLEEMNNSLRIAKEAAEQASLQKSQFLANMSHEIRTPLNAISGFISLLSEKEQDKERMKYFEVIKSSMDLLLQVISDILDISKIESDKLVVEAINFCPYKDLIDIIELFQEKAAQKGIMFNIEYGKDIPECLFSDVYRIKQIISNLLSNAVKFTPEGASITCKVMFEEGTLIVVVADSGIGISAEKQKHVFEPFVQAEESTSRMYGGTGLGLAISSKLASLLGGRLMLESEEGKGSTFTLSIKMAIGDKTKKEVEEEIASKRHFHGHVLIVEDVKANRLFLGILLQKAGLTYDTAVDGLEAIERFKTQTYDLILMDENMPKLGGVAAAKEIMRIEREGDLKHVPIISLTANALKGDKEFFMNAGMDAYLSKPLDNEKLLYTIQKFIG